MTLQERATKFGKPTEARVLCSSSPSPQRDQERHWTRDQSSKGKRIETSLWAGQNTKKSELPGGASSS